MDYSPCVPRIWYRSLVRSTTPVYHEVVQSLFQLIRGQAAHFLEFRERQVEVREGEENLQVPVAGDEVSPVRMTSTNLDSMSRSVVRGYPEFRREP